MQAPLTDRSAADPSRRVGLLSRLTDLDRHALILARTRGHTPAAERAVRSFSSLGQHGICWLALGLGGATLDSARRKRWSHATLTVAAAYATNQAVKLTVRRRRPQLDGLPPLISTPTQLSFPSAHAATSAAAVRAFGALLPAAPLRAVAFAMSCSRLYLGVHYPSDIVAGVALGTKIAKALGSGAPS